MKKIYLICLFLYAWVSAFAQSDIALQNLDKARDSLNSLKRDTAYLPRHLLTGIRRIDTILKKMQEDKDKDPLMLANITSKFNFIRKKLYDIDEDVQQIDAQIRRLEMLFNTASAKVKNGDLSSVYDYRPYQDGLKNYHKQLRKIKRQEKLTAVTIGRYVNKETKYPLITTLIDQYLRQIKDELTYEIDDLQQTISTLKEDTARLSIDIGHLYSDKTLYEKINDNLLARNESLKSDNTLLDVARLKSNAYVATLNTYIMAIKGDSVKTQAFIDAKRLELEKVRADLEIVLQNLDKEKFNITKAKDTLKTTELSLKQTIDSLGVAKDSLMSYSAKLTKAAKKDTQQNIILGILAALVLLSQYQRSENMRKAKMGLQKANDQLKILIRELHHRTKNNFQQISSLLYLQREEIDNTQLKEVLTDACTRIDTMGMIHRQLYQKEEQTLTTIDLKVYTNDLVQHLMKGNAHMDKSIRTNIEVSEIYLEMDMAVQVGLLLNELIQNCFKHAFLKVNNPLLSVQIHNTPPQVLNLTVKDNGQGLGQNINFEHLDTFGLKLVKLLVESNDGDLRYTYDDGAMFNIVMPLPVSNPI
jgi:two-component sensor histidine kinase/archaellum component FlaC